MSLITTTPTLSVAEASLLGGTAAAPRRTYLSVAILLALTGGTR